jgi:hypothetical protein
MKSNAVRNLNGDSRQVSNGSGHGEKLARKEQAAIIALLAHPTIPEAAKAAGISETTLWRWLQRDAFQEKYREAQSKVFDGALAKIQGATMEAVDCLRRNLTCKNPWVAVQAARIILHYSLKSREILDLTDRIAELEAALKDREEAEAANCDFFAGEAEPEAGGDSSYRRLTPIREEAEEGWRGFGQCETNES